MVQLAEQDITTKEVLDWKGVHLFHFAGSSCSQKTRIFMNLKGIDWQSHEILLSKLANYDPWYLGINPRGLVPTLVINGEVHIESNDILTLLDERFDQPRLIPPDQAPQMADLLRHEDDLHFDLRTLTFRYTQARGKTPRPPEILTKYQTNGTGTVQGKTDANKAREIAYWENVNTHGITDEAVRTAASKFRQSLNKLNTQLTSTHFLMGDELTVLDVAWYVYVNRLQMCGYPVSQLHPAVSLWFDALNERDEFSREVAVPTAIREAISDNHRRQLEMGERLIDVADL